MDIKRAILFLLLIIILPALSAADDPTSDDGVVLVTDFTYTIGKTDSTETSRALAFFGAKIKAVILSAKYLTHKGLLEHYGKKQQEIFCLTTDEIQVSIIDENVNEQTKSYFVKIRTKVTSSDFIKAEIKNSALEKKESQLSYREEMGQYVSQTIDPGQELSRAYRHIRRGEWRIAVIYLDHLEKKYPNWGDIYLAKAIGFYSMDDADRMMDALKSACSLDNEEACKDLKILLQTGNTDIKLKQD